MFISILTACLTEIVTNSIEPNFFGVHEVGNDILGMASSNLSNVSNACNYEIPDISLKEVIRLMRDSKTNVMILNVWSKLEDNDTTYDNQTRLINFLWANEVGRTVSLLIHNYVMIFPSLISPMSTVTLTAGFKNVDIFVYAENERCMRLAMNRTSAVNFSYRILLQLYRIDAGYQICGFENSKFVCCAIETIKWGKAGIKEISLCSVYSSVVIHSYTIILFAFFVIFLYFGFPLFLHYINRFKEESQHYKISDSPMALSSIMHTVFIEGQGPVKSFVRRALIVSFVIVTLLPVRNLSDFWGLLFCVVICPWALIFLFSEADRCNKAEHRQLPFIWNVLHIKTIIELIALPFNLKFWWHKFFGTDKEASLTSSTTRKRIRLVTGLERRTNERSESYESIHPISQQSETNHGISNCKRSVTQLIELRICILLFFITYLLFFFPASCIYVFFYVCVDLFYNNARPNTLCKQCKLSHPCDPVMNVIKFLVWLWNSFIVLYFLISFSSFVFFSFILSFAIGIFLNGETYGPYFVPLSTILFYSWINWKLSVEDKYLLLNTSIYEVCREYSPSVRITHGVSDGKRRESSNNDSETENNSNDEINNSGNNNDENNPPNLFDIKLSDDGEPMIPRKLYDKVREKFLPYDQVLFPYFAGVLIVIAFAYFLFVLMSLSQKSGVSSSVQVVGSISGAILPIMFNFVWKQNGEEQKSANKIAMKSKLKRVLVVHHRSDDHEIIEVEFKP